MIRFSLGTEGELSSLGPIGPDTRRQYRFGEYKLDLEGGFLRRGGEEVPLRAKSFEVLTYLVERHGRLVTKAELIEAIWPDATVTDNSLAQCLLEIRRALDDNAQQLIRTVARRGYLFAAPVTMPTVEFPRGSNETVSTLVPPSQAPTGAPTAVDVDPNEPRWRGRRVLRIGAATQPADRWKIITVAAIVVASVSFAFKSHLRGWKLWTAVAIALAALAAGFVWQKSRARRISEKDTIVLADFVNTTGDAVFDDALKQGLRVQLEQSPFLNIVSDQKVNEELQLMGRPNERLTPDLAREVCLRIASKAILTGSISKLGAHYVIGMNALNCPTGDSVGSEQVEADSQEHVLKALGESATKMRRDLGESLKSIQRFDAPLEQVTTRSLQALRAYSLGMKTLGTKGGTAAIPFLQRAVELDPKFAMAYARLGSLYSANLSVENYRKAYELRDKVTERERLYIEGHYYRNVTGEQDKAASVWEVMQQTYPREVESYSNLAGFYIHLGNYEKALEEAHEALRLDPDDQDSYGTVAYLSMCLSRQDEAEAAFKQAEERHLEGEGLLTGRYSLAFLRGDEEGMARVAESAAAGKPLLVVLQGFTEAYYGRLTKARELLRRAAESAKQNGAVDTAASFQAFGGLMEAYLGDLQHARADADAALRLAAHQDVQTAAALALALAGDTEHAEKLTAELNKNFPLDTGVQRVWVLMIRAAVALSHKNPAKAIELLRLMSPYELGAPRLLPIYERGRAYLMLHDGSAAAAEFQKVIDHPGIVREFPVGALANLGVARAYALQGDTARSRAAYQDFFMLWKDADLDVPVLQQAKVEFAGLK